MKPARPRNTTPAFGPVLDFMRLLWALEQGLNQRSKAMWRRHGVTGPQRLLVRVLGELGPTPPVRLAEVLHLHPATVVRIARPLEARGVLRRSRHPTDGRQVLLSLTPAARRFERLEVGTVEGAIRAAVESVPAADLSRARSVLAEVTRRLHEK